MSDTTSLRERLRALMANWRESARCQSGLSVISANRAGEATTYSIEEEAHARIWDQCADELEQLAGALTDGWQPIETVPKDGTVILRPHCIWGAMDVRYITNADAKRVSVLASGIPWQWLNGDYTTAWTDSAFLPFWMPIPDPPGAVAASPSGEGQEEER